MQKTDYFSKFFSFSLLTSRENCSKMSNKDEKLRRKPLLGWNTSKNSAKIQAKRRKSRSFLSYVDDVRKQFIRQK